jgi:two-component system chemotaxis sensor kinase CheA
MDVVRKNVEALQGQVDIESVLGHGTTITVTLPLTLATTQELLVQVHDQTYGIPISSVERIMRIEKKDLAMVQGRQAIVVDSEPVSVVSLARVLEMAERPQADEPAADEKIPVVILRSGRKRIAFLVSGVVGQQESVVKSLGKQLARVRNVAGATILGSGQVIMTLNSSDLMKSARGQEGRTASAQPAAPAAAKGAKRPTVLVVDDSLSTRTLEKNILETAGYQVSLATDGLEAMSLLNANGSFDLILSDVLMPRMSGFELTQAIKRDTHLKKIPVVLVTSLESRADKERGIEVGADAYIVKSNFDQANLLQTIAQLV